MASTFGRGFKSTFPQVASETQRRVLDYVLNQPTPEQREAARMQMEDMRRAAVLREKEQSLTSEEQTFLESQYGVQPGTLAGVRPEIAKFGAPTDVYNPATGQWERRGPKTKSIAGQGGISGEVSKVSVDDVDFLKIPTRGGGARYQVIPFQKGELSAVKETADAISAYGNIKGYFDAVTNVKSEAAKRYATSGILGSKMFFPEVAQAEEAMIGLYTMSRGGKQLTIYEIAQVKRLVKQAAYGEKERVNAEKNFRELIQRGIEATFKSKTLGDAEDYLQKEYQRALSESGGVPRQGTSPPKKPGKTGASDPLGIF